MVERLVRRTTGDDNEVLTVTIVVVIRSFCLLSYCLLVNSSVYFSLAI